MICILQGSRPREVFSPNRTRGPARDPNCAKQRGKREEECRAGFLTNDVGPDSPVVCIAWAFFRYGFLPNLLTYLPTYLLRNHASKFGLDRKMKSKSLDINHISI
jgi:hypothetical protein